MRWKRHGETSNKKSYLENLEGRHSLRDLCLSKGIQLKLIVNVQGVIMLTEVKLILPVMVFCVINFQVTLKAEYLLSDLATVSV